MKLCVNYLNEVKELIEEGKLDFVDFLKLYSISGDLSPFEWCSKNKKVMFHGLVGSEGSNIAEPDFLKGRDVELQKEYYMRGDTPYISVHINRTRDLDYTQSDVKKIIKDNVIALKKIFNMRVLLENVPVSTRTPQNVFLSLPEFINEIVHENDCEFLFDIGHARCAAEALNMSFDEYVSKLPMDKLVETHLSGVMKLKNGRITANHSKMHDEDYEFTRNAIKKYTSLEVVTLEYGPFIERDIQEECPIVSVDGINNLAKIEVYEQLIMLKKIIEEECM